MQCWVEGRTENTSWGKLICDRIWENPPYGIDAQLAQCAFVVPLVKVQIFISFCHLPTEDSPELPWRKKPSFRAIYSVKLPCTELRALTGIRASRDSSSYWFSFSGMKRHSTKLEPSATFGCSFRTAPPRSISGSRVATLCACIVMPFSIMVGVARSWTKLVSSQAKHTIWKIALYSRTKENT